MKIMFDTSALNISKAGVSVYTKELINSLRNSKEKVNVLEIAYSPRFNRNSKWRILDSFYRDQYWQKRTFINKSVLDDVDIVHYPAFNLPGGASRNGVVTIHDAYTLRAPQDFNYWHRKVVNKSIELAIKERIHIITPSEFTKNELLDLFPNADKNRIHVIYSGISRLRYRVKNMYDFSRVKAIFNIDKPFILSVSTIEPRKNFVSLLKAFSILKDRIDHDLVLVGQIGWKSEKLFKLSDQLGLSNRIRFTGYVNDHDLNVLYSEADCFVFPSLYEGFGFTPLEAMKCGCPVLASNTTCMPEILKDTAKYFDPLNSYEIAEAIWKMVFSDDIKSTYSKLGINLSGMYTWNVTAEETINVYKEIVS